jgi:hypothetical protein
MFCSLRTMIEQRFAAILLVLTTSPVIVFGGEIGHRGAATAIWLLLGAVIVLLPGHAPGRPVERPVLARAYAIRGASHSPVVRSARHAGAGADRAGA